MFVPLLAGVLDYLQFSILHFVSVLQKQNFHFIGLFTRTSWVAKATRRSCKNPQKKGLGLCIDTKYPLPKINMLSIFLKLSSFVLFSCLLSNPVPNLYVRSFRKFLSLIQEILCCQYLLFLFLFQPELSLEPKMCLSV